MKVKELLAQLSRLDPELEVLCNLKDQKFITNSRHFILLDIESVVVAEGEHIRLEDDTPYMKIGKSHISQRAVFLGVTSVF